MATPSVLTPKARLSFPALDKPRANKKDPSKPPRYEATLLIPKTPGCTRVQDDPAMKALVAEFCRVRDEKYPNPATRPKGLHNPFLDGDKEDASWTGMAGYAGHWFIRTWNKNLPAYRNEWKNPCLADKFYAGCHVFGAVNCFAFVTDEKSGFSFSLNGVLFAGEGERFGSGGGNDSDDAFAAVPVEDKPVAAAPQSKGDDYF